MDTGPETQDPIQHLDFSVTCSVGHPGGSQQAPDGSPYEPCETPARFITDVHDHPEPSTHFWCLDHLTTHTVWIQNFLAAHDRSVCLGCGKHLHKLEDLLSNVLIIHAPADDR